MITRPKSMAWLEPHLQRTYFFPYRLTLLIAVTSIIQAAATLIGGSVIGLVYAWKVALVAIGEFVSSFRCIVPICLSACIPVLVSTGYIRLVS